MGIQNSKGRQTEIWWNTEINKLVEAKCKSWFSLYTAEDPKIYRRKRKEIQNSINKAKKLSIIKTMKAQKSLWVTLNQKSLENFENENPMQKYVRNKFSKYERVDTLLLQKTESFF